MNKKGFFMGAACLLIVIAAIFLAYGRRNKTSDIQQQLDNYISAEEQEETLTYEETDSEGYSIESTSEESSTAHVIETVEPDFVIVPEYTEDGLLIVTDLYFSQAVRVRQEQTYMIEILGEEMVFPKGTILGLYLDNFMDEDYILKLTGDYNGTPVRNYWNQNQQFYRQEAYDPDVHKVFGNEHVRRLIMDGTIYSCTGLLSGCTKLEEADMKNAYNEYGFFQFQLLFEGCTGLKKVALPENMIEISMGMFMECTALENIDIPESVKSIDALAFYHCKSLKDLRIPDTVETIGFRAFEGCEQLTIIANEGSYAYTYAIEQGIPVKTEN